MREALARQRVQRPDSAAYAAHQCSDTDSAARILSRRAASCARSASVSSNTYSALKHWCAIAVMSGSGSASSSMRRRVSMISALELGVADDGVFEQAQQERLGERALRL